MENIAPGSIPALGFAALGLLSWAAKHLISFFTKAMQQASKDKAVASKMFVDSLLLINTESADRHKETVLLLTTLSTVVVNLGKNSETSTARVLNISREQTKQHAEVMLSLKVAIQTNSNILHSLRGEKHDDSKK